MKYFNDTFFDSVLDILKEKVEEHIAYIRDEYPNASEGCEFDDLWDLADEIADELCKSFDTDMERYLHMEDHHIEGNFNNIKYDYEREFEGKKLSDIVEKFDKDIEDEDTEEFKNWVSDNWFFETFGTFGIGYNFSNELSNFTYSRCEELQKEEDNLSNFGFNVIFDNTFVNDEMPYTDYADAKASVEEKLKENANCANTAYQSQWAIFFTDKEGNETLIINDLGDGRKEFFNTDEEGIIFRYETPSAY